MIRRLLLIFALASAMPLSLMAQVNTSQGTIASQGTDCSATGSSVKLTLSQTAAADASATVVVSGTWSGTLSFAASSDFGRSWAALAGVSWSQPTIAPVSTTGANGAWSFNVAGMTNVCAYMSSYVSGTAALSLASSIRSVASLPFAGLASLTAANFNQPILADASRLRVSTWNDPLTIAGSINTKVATSTNVVNTQTTLTIPAPPPGLYNYVCSLAFTASQDGTATAQTNAVTTSTNFNSYALKYSLTATATINYVYQDWFDTVVGCAKSDLPGTATTFVSPAAGANIAFSWRSNYYQAP